MNGYDALCYLYDNEPGKVIYRTEWSNSSFLGALGGLEFKRDENNRIYYMKCKAPSDGWIPLAKPAYKFFMLSEKFEPAVEKMKILPDTDQSDYLKTILALLSDKNTHIEKLDINAEPPTCIPIGECELYKKFQVWGRRWQIKIALINKI